MWFDPVVISSVGIDCHWAPCNKFDDVKKISKSRYAARVRKICRVVNFAIEEKISVKFFPGICKNPLTTIWALNLTWLPYSLSFSLKTMRLLTAFLLASDGSQAKKRLC